MKVNAGNIIEFVGENVEANFIAETVSINLSKEGNAWVSFILKDKTGRFHAKLWKENMVQGVNYEELAGKVLAVKGFVDMYNGEPSVALNSVKETEDFNQSDFMYCLSDEDKQKYLKRLFDIIEEVQDGSIKSLLTSIFTHFKKTVCELPAGKSLHHAYNGALLVHTLEVAEISLSTYSTCMTYTKEYSEKIDKDFVIAGALLHDIGKVVEYEAFPGCSITLRGSLVGHLVEGVKCINCFNARLKDKAVPVKKMNVLEHLILSSHGGEGGGLKPSLKEAIIIKNADNMSAEIDGYDSVFRSWDEKHPGTRTKSVKNPFTGNYSLRDVFEEV